ncbi:MAG: hypothetical protein IPN02_04410 [Candidatus Microthrix sp.]|uniref:Citrate transporter-like domain-containing protein n=1 Tax=Candidatus Neomicrothrix subdominans TaxID=2954438 RepID=A0A936N9X0_9ACTN|nr:hypothetical protein [Candidatus Microthrix subdominans]
MDSVGTTRKFVPGDLALPALALVAPVAAHLSTHGTGAAFILLGAFTTIVAIVSSGRLPFERWLEARSLPSREAWLPIALVAIGLAFNILPFGSVTSALLSKGGIVAFILSFALISEGLGESGFFHFVAFQVAERCRGSTSRLILYFFILTSVLTFFTSNDIVILALTPIILSVCVQARIRNVKLILLAQFIAANTVAMGLLIGSPSNIIVADGLNLSFGSYLFIMAPVTLFAFFLTYLAISVLVRKVETPGGRIFKRLTRGWEYDASYDVPQFSKYRNLTPEMLKWVAAFGASVVLLALVSQLRLSLYLAALPIACLAIWLWVRPLARRGSESSSSAAPKRKVSSLLLTMPAGIFFFGMAFFVLADAFSSLSVFSNEIVPWLNARLANGDPLSPFIGIGGTGALVNLFNDLPASALVNEALPKINFQNDLARNVSKQASLVGVNISTYVTPVGALAGLLWFNVIQREVNRLRRTRGAELVIEVPDRGDLVRFGTFTFAAVGLALGAVIYGLNGALAYVITGLDTPIVMYDTPARAILAMIGVGVAVASIVMFRRELRRRQVVLSHFRDAFVVFNRLSLLALKHKIAYAVLSVMLFIGSAAGFLYWSEGFHTKLYGGEPEYQSLKEFLVWIVAFLGSGYESELFPNSILGIMLAGLLPLVGIAGIIQILRAPSSASHQKFGEILARGGAPVSRCVLIGATINDIAVISELLEHSDRFVVVMTRDQGLASSVLESAEQRDRLHLKVLSGDVHDDMASFRVIEAQEIIFLADGTSSADYANLQYLGALDNLVHESIDGGTQSRLPKILFECSNRRVEGLLARSISNDLVQRIVVATSGDALGDHLSADLSATVESIERLYAFTGLYREGLAARGLGEAGWRLNLVVLAPEERQLFAEFARHVVGQAATDLGRTHAAQLRLDLEDVLEELASRLECRASQIVCLDVALGGSNALLGVPAAALSLQCGDVLRVGILQQSETRTGDSRGGPRVHIVYATPDSLAFAMSVVRKLDEDLLEGIGLILHVQHGAEIPSALEARIDVVTVRRNREMVDIVKALCDPESVDCLKPGERVYVFSPREGRSVTDLDSLRFIENLDAGLGDTSGFGGSVTHDGVYVAVESRHQSSRFLFEQLFVDRIFDTEVPRRNFFRNLVDSYFRTVEQSEGTSSALEFDEFCTAVKYAEHFRHYEIRRGADPFIGGGLSPGSALVGLPFDEACLAVRQRSQPPLQLLGLAKVRRVERVENEPGSGRLQMDAFFPQPDVLIEADHRLLLVPFG